MSLMQMIPTKWINTKNINIIQVFYQIIFNGKRDLVMQATYKRNSKDGFGQRSPFLVLPHVSLIPSLYLDQERRKPQETYNFPRNVSLSLSSKEQYVNVFVLRYILCLKGKPYNNTHKTPRLLDLSLSLASSQIGTQRVFLLRKSFVLPSICFSSM